MPLPNRILAAIRESVALIGCLLVGFLFCVLITYSPDDPAFAKALQADSQTLPLGNISNIGGLVGAYVSSVLLELFGWSAYAFCLMLLFVGWNFLFGSASLKSTEESLGLFWIILGGVLFMIAAAALEYLRFHFPNNLPAGAGGIIGKTFADFLLKFLGVLGASLFYIAILIFSISLVSGLSWFSFFEAIGGGVQKMVYFLYRGMLRKRRADSRAKRAKKVADDKPAEPVEDPPADLPREPVVSSNPQRIAAKKHKLAIPATRVVAVDSTENNLAESQAEQGDAPANLKPDVNLLEHPEHSEGLSEAELQATATIIEETLASFNVGVKVMGVLPGPVVTRFDLQPDTGVKGTQVVNLARDLARALSVSAIRVMENIPGTKYIGLELPNYSQSTVVLSEILESDIYRNCDADLPVALGKTAEGEVSIVDLRTMPHLLVAGSTGSGKSVFINSTILSLLFAKTPADIRFIMIDPKMLELSAYSAIPHLLAPVVTDMAKAPLALEWTVQEMEDRYQKMTEAGVRNIDGYNHAVREGHLSASHQHLPYIVVIIDELADLMMVAGKAVEVSISRLAQKARAAGIHLILATQRPSVDVITGLIKSNVPARLSFQVATKIDSRTVLDQMGAETLLGKGDMLFLPPGVGQPIRAHGAFVSDNDVHAVVGHIVENNPPVEYLAAFDETATPDKNGNAGEEDEAYDQAVAYVLEANRPSISFVQRKLSIGYNRAARIIEAMEAARLITAPNSQGVRRVIKKDDYP